MIHVITFISMKEVSAQELLHHTYLTSDLTMDDID